MKTEEALQYADQWADGHTFHEGSQGWRVVCATLAAEVRRLRAAQSVRNLSMQMCDRALIKDVFLRHGFRLSNETGDDLKEYVYEAAESLLAAFGLVRQPLTDEQIKRGKAEADPERQDLCGWSFEMGVAFAEKSHRITGG